jgi:hypothetical protein
MMHPLGKTDFQNPWISFRIEDLNELNFSPQIILIFHIYWNVICTLFTVLEV